MRRAASILFVATALAASPACQTNYTQHPCRDVPPGGCPLAEGEACNDPACAAAYACNPDGTWTLDHPCPGYVADAGKDAADAGILQPFEASDFDAPPGAFGGACAPALQDEDCQLGVALACPRGGADPCCGCSALFTCASDGTWVPWGYCSADAGIVYAP